MSDDAEKPSTPENGESSPMPNPAHAKKKKPGPEEPTTIGASGKLKPGKFFAWFELQSELERGSTGAVWLAQDYSFGRQVDQVALRFLPDHFGSDKIAVENLKNEVRRLATLNHPNILHTYEVVESKGGVAIQMEYLEGQSQSSLRLARPNQVFEVRDLEKWLKKVCQALEYAHRDLGLMHGDIMPGNLVVDSSGEVKLKNFGIEDCIAASTGRAMGPYRAADKVPSRSPQRATGEVPTVTDDLYSLGATLYELLTSKPPLSADEIGFRASSKVPSSMAERRAEVGIQGEVIPQNWEETVAACLAKDPARRPQSAREVEQRLTSAGSLLEAPEKSREKSVFESTPKPPSPVRTLPALNRWKIVVGILFILAVGSALAFFLFRQLTQPKLGRDVLNPNPGKTTVFLDARSPAPTIPPPQPAYPTKESSPAVPTLPAEVSPTPSIEVSPIPSTEATPTPATEGSPTPSPGANPTPSAEASPMPSPQVSTTPALEPSGSPPVQGTATPTETPPGSSSPTPLSQQDADAIKEDVLRRINALPGVTAEKKASLVAKMNRARSMERLAVIPFDSGRSTLRRAAADELVKTFGTPEMREKLSDPTIVLVVAGYADAGGRADLNLRISKTRAENVSRILKEQANLLNAMQTIGMGGTELLDSKRPDLNRAVEVWAVVPL